MPVARLLEFQDQSAQICYEFSYIETARVAVQAGFLPYLGLPELRQVYRSSDLFPLFSTRVFSPKRPEFKDYIQALGLTLKTATPLNFLGRTCGRKVTDRVEMFPLPMRDSTTGLYISYSLLCGIPDQSSAVEDPISRLQPGERLFLQQRAQSVVDEDSIAVRTKDNTLIGHFPHYLLDYGRSLNGKTAMAHAYVEQINPVTAPTQQRLLCRLEMSWPHGLPLFHKSYQPLADTAALLPEPTEIALPETAR